MLIPAEDTIDTCSYCVIFTPHIVAYCRFESGLSKIDRKIDRKINRKFNREIDREVFYPKGLKDGIYDGIYKGI